MTDQQRLNQLNQAYQTKSKAYFAFLQARAGEELTAEDRKAATELYDPVWAIHEKIKSLEYKINRSYENNNLWR